MDWRKSGCGVRKVSVLMQEVLSMSKQKMFFSFEYNKDAWRAAQIRNVCKGSVEVLATDREWEEGEVRIPGHA